MVKDENGRNDRICVRSCKEESCVDTSTAKIQISRDLNEALGILHGDSYRRYLTLMFKK